MSRRITRRQALALAATAPLTTTLHAETAGTLFGANAGFTLADVMAATQRLREMNPMFEDRVLLVHPANRYIVATCSEVPL